MDTDGTVRLRVLDHESEPATALADLVREVYEEALAGPGLPVDAEELVLGMLARRPDAFNRPQPPLAELAVAAGLERRRQQFAHDTWVWQRQEETHQLFRVMARLDDRAEVHNAIRALRLLQQEAMDVAGEREALAALYDPVVLEVVCDELLRLDDDDDDDDDAPRPNRLHNQGLTRRPESGGDNARQGQSTHSSVPSSNT